MALRPPVNPEYTKELRDRLRKQLGRLYALWLLGIAVGAVQLKVQVVGVLGTSFTLGRPELLEGMIFFGCIAYYFAIIGELMLNPYENPGQPMIRKMLYIASRQLSARRFTAYFERKMISRFAWTGRDRRRQRRALVLPGLFMVRVARIAYLWTPLLHILFWRRPELRAAFQALVS
jgi:pimeloyl-ACP methyl ester carboxylesterase